MKWKLKIMIKILIFFFFLKKIEKFIKNYNNL